MKLTSTNRPFSLTIKFTRIFFLAHLTEPCQRGDLDGDPSLGFLMLFSCERSPAVVIVRAQRQAWQARRHAPNCQIGALAPAQRRVLSLDLALQYRVKTRLDRAAGNIRTRLQSR